MSQRQMSQRIVIKVGGATLFQPGGFETALKTLLATYANDQVMLLVGGGDLIEAVRTLHKLYPQLDSEAIHWRCVELLDHTWEIAKQLFPAGRPIRNRCELDELASSHVQPGVFWIRAQSFYTQIHLDSIPKNWIPESSWNTTTDAIAWLLGKMIDADQVVLMKQCQCDATWTIAEAASRGVVDSELARLVALNGNARPTVHFSWGCQTN